MTSYRRPEQKVPALELLRRSSTRGAQSQTNATSCSSFPPLQPDRLPVPSIAEDGHSATRPRRKVPSRVCTSEMSIAAVEFPGSGVPGGSRGPVLQRLADVFGVHPLSSIKVGNRTGDLEDLVIPPSAEAEPCDSHSKERLRIAVQCDELAHLWTGKVGVGTKAAFLEDSPRTLPGKGDTLTDCCRGLACMQLAQLRRLQTRNGKNHVEAVQERPADPAAIPPDIRG